MRQKLEIANGRTAMVLLTRLDGTIGEIHSLKLDLAARNNASRPIPEKVYGRGSRLASDRMTQLELLDRRQFDVFIRFN
ncbi:MAG: hypothetical protein RIC24_03545 [Hyphomicrobiales bacterium]|jgi:hypothetical protein